MQKTVKTPLQDYQWTKQTKMKIHHWADMEQVIKKALAVSQNKFLSNKTVQSKPVSKTQCLLLSLKCSVDQHFCSKEVKISLSFLLKIFWQIHPIEYRMPQRVYTIKLFTVVINPRANSIKHSVPFQASVCHFNPCLFASKAGAYHSGGPYETSLRVQVPTRKYQTRLEVAHSGKHNL